VLYPEEPEKRVKQMGFFGRAFVEVFKTFDVAPDIVRFNEAQPFFISIAIENDVRCPREKGESNLFKNVKYIFTTHTPEAAALLTYDNLGWLQAQIGSDLGQVEDFKRDDKIGRFVLNLAKQLAENPRTTVINAVSQEHAEVTKIAILHEFINKILAITNGSDPELWKSNELKKMEEEIKAFSGPEASPNGEQLFSAGRFAKQRLQQYLMGTVSKRTITDILNNSANGANGNNNRESWQKLFKNPAEEELEFVSNAEELFNQAEHNEIYKIFQRIWQSHRHKAFTHPERPLAALVRRFVAYKEQRILFNLAIWITGERNQLYFTPWGSLEPGLEMNLLIGGVGRDPEGKSWVERFKKYATHKEFNLQGKLIFIDGSGTKIMQLATQAADVWISMPRSTREACGTSDQRIRNGLNIATKTGGPMEYIEHKINGWLMDVFSGTYSFDYLQQAYNQLNLPQVEKEKFTEIVQRLQVSNPQMVKFYFDASQALLGQYLQEASRTYYAYVDNPQSDARWLKMLEASYKTYRKMGIIRMVQQYAELFEFVRGNLNVSFAELAQRFKNLDDTDKPVSQQVEGSLTKASASSSVEAYNLEILEKIGLQDDFNGREIFGKSIKSWLREHFWSEIYSRIDTRERDATKSKARSWPSGHIKNYIGDYVREIAPEEKVRLAKWVERRKTSSPALQTTSYTSTLLSASNLPTTSFAYPATLPTANLPDRAATKDELRAVVNAFGRRKIERLAAQHVNLKNNLVISPAQTAAVVTWGRTLFVNPNLLRGPPSGESASSKLYNNFDGRDFAEGEASPKASPPRQKEYQKHLEAIFAGHELYHLLYPALSEHLVRAFSIFYLLWHNLLESHIAWLENNTLGLKADYSWLITLKILSLVKRSLQNIYSLPAKLTTLTSSIPKLLPQISFPKIKLFLPKVTLPKFNFKRITANFEGLSDNLFADIKEASPNSMAELPLTQDIFYPLPDDCSSLSLPSQLKVVFIGERL
jgi:glucan phosphorylase